MPTPLGRSPRQTTLHVRPMRRFYEDHQMKRIDQYKARLKIAKSEIKHKTRQLNAATRSYNRTKTLIDNLEAKINAIHMAKP